MKKLFLLILCLAINTLCVFAEDNVLKGGVVYTIETAKNAAFSGLDLKIDKSVLEPYLKDKYNKENRASLKSGLQPQGRSVISFEMKKGLIKGYAVVYEEKPEYVFYYSTGGYLVALDIDTQINEYIFPYKIGKYNPVTGNLISVGLYVSEEEQFVYLKNGKLKAHWIGDKAYNEKGKVIAKRSEQ